MDKITRWVVIRGKPVESSRTRRIARIALKCLRKTIWVDEFVYIGKVIEDSKRPGHGKIVLEY